MTNFLPNDYDLPTGGSKYMKLSEGANTFRILSPAITGWEYWEGSGSDRKPVRVKTKDEVPDKYLNTKDWQMQAKHFWAFVVWNRNVEEVQILELKQKELMRAIKGFVENKKWGDPTQYDIVITKTKTGSDAKDVEYTVIPDPKEEMDAGIMQYYKDLGVNLNALYEGEDPFNSTGTVESVEENEFDDIDFGDLDSEPVQESKTATGKPKKR